MPRVREKRIKQGRTLFVPAVGANPAFQVKLRAPAEIAPEVMRTRTHTPLFIVADTHGEFERGVLDQLAPRKR